MFVIPRPAEPRKMPRGQVMRIFRTHPGPPSPSMIHHTSRCPTDRRDRGIASRHRRSARRPCIRVTRCTYGTFMRAPDPSGTPRISVIMDQAVIRPTPANGHTRPTEAITRAAVVRHGARDAGFTKGDSIWPRDKTGAIANLRSRNRRKPRRPRTYQSSHPRASPFRRSCHRRSPEAQASRAERSKSLGWDAVGQEHSTPFRRLSPLQARTGADPGRHGTAPPIIMNTPERTLGTPGWTVIHPALA